MDASLTARASRRGDPLRVQQALHGGKETLGAAGRDDDFRVRVVRDAIAPLVEGSDLLPQRPAALLLQQRRLRQARAGAECAAAALAKLQRERGGAGEWEWASVAARAPAVSLLRAGAVF